MSISERLREERVRLGLNQVEFGALGGVKKLAQINYEKGERVPDGSYLAAVAAAGADVLYILTGQRANPPASTTALAPDEEILLDNYRHAPAGVKAGVKTTLETFAPDAGVKRGKAA